MSLELLRMDVVRSLGYVPDVSIVGPAHPWVTSECPAAVVEEQGKLCIKMSHLLSQDERCEAEAHELAHLKLRSEGLVALNPSIVGDKGLPWECAELAMEVSNAISHRFVIDLLQAEYGISSGLHIVLRSLGLRKDLTEDAYIENYPAFLHTYGVTLFDIERTVSDKLPEVDRRSRERDAVSAALAAARQHLSAISPEQLRAQQEGSVGSFLKQLGYNPSDFGL